MPSYGSADVTTEADGGGARRAPAQSQDPGDGLPLIWSTNDDDGKERKNADHGGGKADEGEGGNYNAFHYVVYALINVIIAVPGLYGYASVIFNHPSFQPHMAKLSKLVVFSSLVHQLGFALFSGLDFAIGTVQDAGLIFLSAMSNSIADSILEGGGTVDEVVSTTLVILPLGTAALGAVLMLLGKFRLLDIVSYLPMPVIGGYLAFIGYFCLEAGVALCIGKPMTELADWRYLLDPHSLLLAVPGLVSAGMLTVISRKATNDAILPITMVLIPAAFYAVLLASGVSLEEAREHGWVGEEAPPVPVSDLLHLVDFKLVHWNLVGKCIGTWIGMVFVVSFASCLDIAAISMDMGEALDTNKEMVTVGTSNLMSGLLFGFTGSYIFSQTIFTYRTGCHSRYVGVLIMAAYLAVCVSTINILQIAPLFFLGATLIFIGYDLLWEWLIDIRVKIFFMEYMILLVTFVAIQIIGMDFGIMFGVMVALVEHIASTTRNSSVGRVLKRSRAVWSKEDYKTLHIHGYGADDPKIVTLELRGPVFFGSSAKLLQDITHEIGLSISEEDAMRMAIGTPHVSTPLSSVRARRVNSPAMKKKKKGVQPQAQRRTRPQFVVLDFTQMHNLDASAATSCFLQLAKMCEKQGMLLFASGAIPRVEWMLRSHDVTYGYDEEINVKNNLLSSQEGRQRHGRVILFLTIFEALEFSERLLIQSVSSKVARQGHSLLKAEWSALSVDPSHHELTYIFQNVLRGDLSQEEKELVDGIGPYYQEAKYQPGEPIFQKNTHPGAFYVVLRGAVAVPRERMGSRQSMIRSGAGRVTGSQSLSSSNLIGLAGDGGASKSVESFYKVGGIFGYCDFLLERYRTFDAVAAQGEGATVAVFNRALLDKMRHEDDALHVIVQKLLLQASLMDLANCTCHN